jgi:CDGSH-type Zn-finger protein
MGDTTIQVAKDGPLIVTGSVQLSDAQGQAIVSDASVVALCRCGASGNKPFCDGAHKSAGFTD